MLGMAFAPAALRAAIATASASDGDVPQDAPGQARTVAGAQAPATTRWLLCLHDAIAHGRYNDAAMAAARAAALAGLAGLAVMMLGRRRGTRAGRSPAPRGDASSARRLP
jgi:hypothetical protein